ncbi:MAG: hypothetical protein Q9M97_05280 [Candidatus Gracilibacteria bacterium]|nr:hypothetical protein [Candidatus Gracilibacteria bacterium]
MEKELFLQALGLKEPWYIKEVKLDIENERLDIYLDFEKGTKFENIDGDYVTAFQTVKKDMETPIFLAVPNISSCKSTQIKR